MISPAHRHHQQLAIEYCDVGSVSDVMKATGEPLNEQQICCIMYQALKGLEYLHSKHKIHRDIKAGNILVTYAGDCKLGMLLSLI